MRAARGRAWIWMASLMLCAGLGQDGFSRDVIGWSYQKLFERSDIIVIGTPAEETKTTSERSELPDVGLPVIGVETRFVVFALLKGTELSAKTIVLHHYRTVDSKELIIDPPLLVSFTPKENSRYLLFLVREKDGRYAPTGGQTDPALWAIQKLRPGPPP